MRYLWSEPSCESARRRTLVVREHASEFCQALKVSLFGMEIKAIQTNIGRALQPMLGDADFLIKIIQSNI